MDRVDFLREYGSFGKESDAAGIWELVHRLDEMDEYIQCVEAMYACLNEEEIQSEGLLALKEYVGKIYTDGGFEELKKDIHALKVDASKVKSSTLGVNLNDRYEPVEVGIVSINGKTFTKSGVITYTISGMLPELLYYIRWAEYVEKLQKNGFAMCKPRLLEAVNPFLQLLLKKDIILQEMWYGFFADLECGRYIIRICINWQWNWKN